MRRLVRFARLAAWERRVLLRALLLLPVSAVRIRRLGVRASLSGPLPARRGVPDIDAQAIAQRVATLVHIAARQGPFRASCLPICVTVHRLLRERGIAADVRVGVRKVGARLEAHAWVERGGHALYDSERTHERFAPFEAPIARLPGAPR